MTWADFHRRGDVLRTVISAADTRRDGLLPTDLPGVEATFRDEIDLLGTLHLRWHTRLAGAIERYLDDEPSDLERAVVSAWLETADALPGIRLILDHYAAQPATGDMSRILDRAIAKERHHLAVMSGRGSLTDTTPSGAAVGALIEERARRSRTTSRAA